MLIGFKRISIKIGEKTTIRFTVKASQFAFLDKNMEWKVEAGEMNLQVGSSSKDIRLCDKFRIIGNSFIEPSTRGFYADAIEI